MTSLTGEKEENNVHRTALERRAVAERKKSGCSVLPASRAADPAGYPHNGKTFIIPPVSAQNQ